MPLRQTQTEEYWVNFQVVPSDIDYLYNVLLERETPLSLDEMTLVLMRYRVQQENARLAGKAHSGKVYRPAEHYSVGDEIVFPLMNYSSGKVTAVRRGYNPDCGDFSVIKVSFPDGKVLEFASELTVDHPLNHQEEEAPLLEDDLRTPEELFIEYGGEVANSLEKHLLQHDDLVRLAGRWFPRSLLLETNIGHLNLAEAVLYMNNGGPMTTREIIEAIGIGEGVNERLVEFSLNYGLQEDERFDEVGPAGQVLWFLTQMEPPEVLKTPARLEYTPIPYNPDLLTPELREIELEIGDEHSNVPMPRGAPPDSITVTLTYPHHRAGTLPLSPQLKQMFPTAYEAPRIRFTLIDEETGEEIPAWVVRTGGYVYGLAEWLQRSDIPVGTYLTIRRTGRPDRVALAYGKHRPRIEWVRTAIVDGDHLRFENLRRPVGTDYDELMIVDVLEPKEVDLLWQRITKRNVPLEQLLISLARELTPLAPRGHIHAKTLYSVVNILRRCPPGPIFANLVALPQFAHVGGPYWRLAEDAL